MLKFIAHFISGFYRKMRDAFRLPSVTVKYPEVMKPLAAMARLSLRNDFSECTGCRKCDEICPVQALGVMGQEYTEYDIRPTTSKGIPFEMKVQHFRVDYSRCVFCGLCVQVCPTGSMGFSKSVTKPVNRNKALTVDLVHVPRAIRKEIEHEA